MGESNADLQHLVSRSTLHLDTFDELSQSSLLDPAYSERAVSQWRVF